LRNSKALLWAFPSHAGEEIGKEMLPLLRNGDSPGEAGAYPIDFYAAETGVFSITYLTPLD